MPQNSDPESKKEVEATNLIPALGKTDLQKTVIFGKPLLRVYVGLGRAKTKKPVKQEPDRLVIQTRQPV